MIINLLVAVDSCCSSGLGFYFARDKYSYKIINDKAVRQGFGCFVLVLCLFLNTNASFLSYFFFFFCKAFNYISNVCDNLVYIQLLILHCVFQVVSITPQPTSTDGLTIFNTCISYLLLMHKLINYLFIKFYTGRFKRYFFKTLGGLIFYNFTIMY